MPGSITDGSSTVNFLTTRGRPPGPSEETQDITRPGVDGHEGRKTGVRAKAGTVQVTASASSWSDAQDAADALEALVGEICTFTDSGGESHPSCLLQAVRITGISAVGHLVGASGDHLVRAQLRLLDVRSSG